MLHDELPIFLAGIFNEFPNFLAPDMFVSLYCELARVSGFGPVLLLLSMIPAGTCKVTHLPLMPCCTAACLPGRFMRCGLVVMHHMHVVLRGERGRAVHWQAVEAFSDMFTHYTMSAHSRNTLLLGAMGSANAFLHQIVQ